MIYNLLTILGPTASGKTNLAASLAVDLNGEVISADSRQVYRGMDIGTGKDLHEFTDRNINYHLIDICEPTDEYNLFTFQQDFTEVFTDITNRSKFPIMVGGSGLYLSAILQNYKLPPIKKETERFNKLDNLSTEVLTKKLIDLKPDLHNTTDLTDRKRIIKAILIEESRKNSPRESLNIKSLNIGIIPVRKQIKKNITHRLKSRLESGLIEEVKSLIEKGITEERLHFFGLEYKYLSLYIHNRLNYNDMFQKLNSAINTFAKKQITWYRKMEREGVFINWYSGENYEEILNFTERKLKRTNANS